MNLRALLFLPLCAVLVGCVSEAPEKAFYSHLRREWPLIFTGLSPTEQWQVYIYGIRTRRPPPYELAVELAKEKRIAITYIVSALRERRDRAELNGVSAVLQMMQEVVRYDPCDDSRFSDQLTQEGLVKLPDGQKYKCLTK